MIKSPREMKASGGKQRLHLEKREKRQFLLKKAQSYREDETSDRIDHGKRTHCLESNIST